MSDSSNFALHILDIFHFQGMIYSFLYAFKMETLWKYQLLVALEIQVIYRL